MHRDIRGDSATKSMTAAKACYQQIPDTYRGKGHLGLTIAALDKLVARVATLRDHMGRVARCSHD